MLYINILFILFIHLNCIIVHQSLLFIYRFIQIFISFNGFPCKVPPIHIYKRVHTVLNKHIIVCVKYYIFIVIKQGCHYREHIPILEHPAEIETYKVMQMFPSLTISDPPIFFSNGFSKLKDPQGN